MVRFEYKDFAFIGQESTRAAEAASCALEQDSFWQYHDTLFANQIGENVGSYTDDRLRSFAAALGLNQDDFNACLDSDRYSNEVSDSNNAAKAQGVGSTPTFRINGQLREGLISFEQLQSIIDQTLGSAQ